MEKNFFNFFCCFWKNGGEKNIKKKFLLFWRKNGGEKKFEFFFSAAHTCTIVENLKKNKIVSRSSFGIFFFF